MSTGPPDGSDRQSIAPHMSSKIRRYGEVRINRGSWDGLKVRFLSPVNDMLGLIGKRRYHMQARVVYGTPTKQ